MQQLLNALSVGSIYAMLAVGLALIYGTLRILHIAHAAVYAAGAYLGMAAYMVTGSFLVSLAAAAVLAGLLGVLMHQLLYKPMLSRPPIGLLIASIGMVIFMSDFLRVVGGPHQLPFDVPALRQRHEILGLELSTADIIIFGGSTLIFVALWWLLNRTRPGMAIRAVAQDADAARTMGINVDATVRWVFFTGSAIAAFGGVMIAVIYNAVYPTMGDMLAYKGLALIVIGGFGSIVGAVVSAYLLGIAETYITTYTSVPLSREGIAMLMLILLILVRPQGLFGKR